MGFLISNWPYIVFGGIIVFALFKGDMFNGRVKGGCCGGGFMPEKSDSKDVDGVERK
jgi:hypothetical protein